MHENDRDDVRFGNVRVHFDGSNRTQTSFPDIPTKDIPRLCEPAKHAVKLIVDILTVTQTENLRKCAFLNFPRLIEEILYMHQAHFFIRQPLTPLSRIHLPPENCLLQRRNGKRSGLHTRNLPHSTETPSARKTIVLYITFVISISV